MKPKFSIVMIAKNEEKTLPKCRASLDDFINQEGEVILVDTGSTDKTVEIARGYGFKVFEVGEKFIKIIDEETAKKINDRFIVGGEKNIVEEGNRLFDFAEARNYATSLASNDMICTLDADEAYSVLNIDKLNELIEAGAENFCYQFVFAHDQWGKPAVQFVQSKMFDRRKMQWTGIVHEVLQGNVKTDYIGPDIIFLEHWQIPGGDHRGNYLVGLALDCFENPDKDRQSHYLAREMLWTGRPASAIEEFWRHIDMNKWPAERAQSMIFTGDAFGKLNKPDAQVIWYSKAIQIDPLRREAFIKLAQFYLFNKQYLTAIAYAKAALEIPWSDYYANDKAMYEQIPHEILYRAYGWLGNISEARKHILKALEYQPLNPMYLHDTRYYFEYGANNIEGWMTFPEQQFLYETAKQHYFIAELGSWKGRSTHALASGMGEKGVVKAIDTFEGSAEEGDLTNGIAKKENIYEQFVENTKQFTNIEVVSSRGDDYIPGFVNKIVDVIFIDAGHTYEEVKEDIEMCLPKTKMVICGHDYFPGVWDGVVKAVDEKFGKPDGVAGTIWYKYLVPKISILLPTMNKRPEGLKRCLYSIDKLNYPKELIEIIILDGEGTVPEKVARGLWQSKGEYIVFAADDMEFEKDCIWEALQEDKGLVGFNAGPVSMDNGNICEHFMIKKDFVKEIGGMIFDTEFHHVGCDNLLYHQALKKNQFAWSPKAIITHNHFSKGAEYDEVYAKGWSQVENDRKILERKLQELYD